VNEDIKCYATEDHAYEESEVQESNFSHLQEHFEALVPTAARMIVEASVT
jgi:hypothetical protein